MFKLQDSLDLNESEEEPVIKVGMLKHAPNIKGKLLRMKNGEDFSRCSHACQLRVMIK